MHDDVIAVVERLGTHAYQPLGHDLALRSLDLDRVALDEVPGVRLHADTQEAATVMLECLQRSLVDVQRAATGDREGDPRLARRQPCRSRVKGRAETRFAAHGVHEKRLGQRDASWPEWYATYMVAEQSGKELPQ